jgi:hypothetical protein
LSSEIDRESDRSRLPPERPVGELVWVAGGSVDACAVALRFFGDDLEPDEITKLLGVPASKSYRKGDILRGEKYDIIQKTGSWRLQIEKCTDVELEDLINSLLDRLPSDPEIWKNLGQRFNADLFCGLWLEQWNRCMDFTPQTLVRIGERGLMLQLDIYTDRAEIEEEVMT